MMDHAKRRRAAAVVIGLLTGLGISLGCAGKGKRSRSPEECMSRCEQEQCGYDPYTTDNDEYLECLEACQDGCS